MKKLFLSRNYGRKTSRLFGIVLSFLALLTLSTSMNAQCQLNVEDLVHVVLSDNNCDATFTELMFLTDDGMSCTVADHYEFEVRTADGVNVLIPMSETVVLDASFIGGPYMVIIEAHNTAHSVLNTAMTTFDVADNMPPTIDCPIDPIEISCWQEEVFLLPTNDNCSSVELIWTDQLVTTNDCTLGWPVERFKEIWRTYVAVDSSGNQSIPCAVVLRVNRLSDHSFYDMFPRGDAYIKMVPNLENSIGTAISCVDADSLKDANGDFDPNLTGWPSLIYLDPNPTQMEIDSNDTRDTILLDNSCTSGCNLASTYIDVKVNTCPNCVEKVIRMWTVVETSCQHPERFRLDAQHIEVYDDIAPVVVCPDDLTITTNVSGDFGPTIAGNLDCGSMFTFPVPEMSDECCNQLTWAIAIYNDLGFPIMFADTIETKTPVIRALPFGENHVYYDVYDKCGNRTTCEWFINVVDNTPPVPVCQVATTISLTYDGEAELYAPSLNSGSYDDCAIDMDRFEIKRMGEDDSAYASYITFTCEDNTFQVALHQITMRVWDKAGNSNECMVFVGVQDKFPPSISCPDDEFVVCDHIYEPGKLKKYFGWPTAYDNCGVTITTDSSTVESQCYDKYVKEITRTFLATDEGGRTAECEQIIRFYKDKYFGYQNGFTNGNGFGAITWPGNVEYSSCMDPNTANDPNSLLHPNQTNRPTMNEFACDEVGATYSDFLLVDNDNDLDNTEGCFKIIRTWTVLDDCHKINGTFAKWSYDQVIFVKNYVDPTLDQMADETICTFDSTCTDGFIELEYSFSDDCTQAEDLRWRYILDLFNDGINIETSVVFAGDTVKATGDYPIGTHKIVWQVWDQCGNSVIREQFFTIQNCKTPTPICKDGLTTDIQNMSPNAPSVTITDTMFNCCSYHTCGYDLVFSFSQDTSDHTKIYYCSDLGPQSVELWVTTLLSNGEITQDFCTTTIDVQDNFTECSGPLPQGIVSGIVMTEDNRSIENVEVNLLGSELGSQSTNINGEFVFDAVDTKKSYSVAPISSNDYMNGISTLDLVYIQKYLLDIKDINSPYLLIASDVNNDKVVSASDILELRKLILGANDKFKNNSAWKFIASEYQFDNPKKAMVEDIAGNYLIDNLSGDIEVGFIAIKIGDVSGDVRVNDGDDVESRSDETLTFAIDNRHFERNDILEIPIYAKDFIKIQGFQNTFTFDQNAIEFESIESGALNVSSANIATNRLDQGYLPFSWYKANALDIDDNAVLFTITFKVIESNQVKNVLSINSDITKTEAYNNSLDRVNLELEFRNDESGFELLQNRPNPFVNSTEISFSLPIQDQYTLNIFDLSGKLIYETSGTANKGENTIVVEKSSLNVSGILYYTLSTEKYTATRKMVVIK